ncbi:hypothetical protein [Metarhizobium album]|uniref:hypothetical protein n=1 Tax=Metarhizobium album TaxID=2182425 RepID=UPI000FFEC58F|nr:hypothetical protein [Rhizobium album]
MFPISNLLSALNFGAMTDLVLVLTVRSSRIRFSKKTQEGTSGDVWLIPCGPCGIAPRRIATGKQVRRSSEWRP